MANIGFKDLSRRTTFDKVFHDKAFNNPQNPKLDGCQHGIVSMVYNCFDKKPTATKANKSVSHPGKRISSEKQ